MRKLIFLPVIIVIAIASITKIDVPSPADDRPLVPKQFRDRCNLVDDTMSYMEDNQMTETREYHILAEEIKDCERLQKVFRWR